MSIHSQNEIKQSTKGQNSVANLQQELSHDSIAHLDCALPIK